MNKNRHATNILFMAGLVASLATPLALLQTEGDPYTDFSPESGFPVDEKGLIEVRDNDHVGSMRKHAWWVWSLLAQETNQGAPLCSHCSTPTPIWHTWYSKDEAFANRSEDSAFASSMPTQRLIQQRFEAPIQLLMQPEDSVAESEGTREPRNITPMSRVLFNKAAKEHIQDCELHLKTTLNGISTIATFRPKCRTDGESIPKFPREAVVLKTVWWPIKKEGSTLLPVWDSSVEKIGGENRIEMSFRIKDWKQWVAVAPDYDPSVDGKTTEKLLPGNPPSTTKQVRLVPLSRLHHLQITENDLKSVQTTLRSQTFARLTKNILEGSQPAAGDFLVLVAIHVVTKELPDWVWATFWWNDKPELEPYASGRPDSVEGVWRNYLMDTTMSKEEPRETDGLYNVCYNPWLEGIQSGGIVSNCIRCHQHARWGDQIELPASDSVAQDPKLLSRFENRLDLDYLFSIAMHHR